MAPTGQAVERRIRACLKDLDAMPLVFRKLVRMLDGGYPSARELGQLIATDQGLSVRVLRMVNSAASGVRSPVANVAQAVNLLGINVVRSLTVCLASYDSLFSGTDAEKTRLWRHGLACAVFCRAVSEMTRIGNAEELFVAGMLHDVGRSVLAKHYPRESRMLSVRKPVETLLEAEQRILGTTHAEVGYWACQCWRLPECLQTCVRYHHDPELAGEFRNQACVVHIADMLSVQAFEPQDPELELAHLDLLEELKLTPDKLQSITDKSMCELSELEAYVAGAIDPRAHLKPSAVRAS